LNVFSIAVVEKVINHRDTESQRKT
jgi:hypothetical protein